MAQREWLRMESGLTASSRGWKEIVTTGLPERLHLQVHQMPVHARSEWVRSQSLDPLQSTLFYLATRSAADAWAHRLSRLRSILAPQSSEVLCYHAGWSQEERRVQEEAVRHQLDHDQKPWIVATAAFGMGMDFHGLDRLIAVDPPMSVMSLAQLVGRVGRAGRSGQAHILWSEEDFWLQRWALQPIGSQAWHEARKLSIWLHRGARRDELEELLR